MCTFELNQDHTEKICTRAPQGLNTKHVGIMVLPVEVGDAAMRCEPADSARVQAWLDSGGDVNDITWDGFTLLNCCASAHYEINGAHISLARTLIALGADVNIGDGYRSTPLHNACLGHGVASLDMIRLLLDAKANPNAKDEYGRNVGGVNNLHMKTTPLFHAIHSIVPPHYESPHYEFRPRITRILLRAGASLDSCNTDETIEEVMQARETTAPALLESDHWLATKALIADVRKHGTYKKYMRAPHRDVLTMRGLAQRGKLQTDHRALNFLAMQGDNGIVWNILSYWRATN